MNEKYDFLTKSELTYLNDKICEYIMKNGLYCDTKGIEEEILEEIMEKRRHG